MVLGMLGSKAFGGRVRNRRLGRHEDAPESTVATSADPVDAAGENRPRVNNGVRWARLVGRAPVVIAVIAVVGLGALAIPAIRADTGAQILITPRTGADDAATLNLLNALRDGQSGVESQTGTRLGVTGVTAIQADVSQRLSEALPPYLAVVIGLAFILLMLVFRSVLVPLTATLGFLLTVLATLGLTVEVFQKGLFGLIEPASLVSFMPVLLIGIVFGLAMDYQVFLVTRMREAHVHGQNARESVADGFRHGARVVTAAAIIMISVFAAFILQANSLIQSMGFALAVAVFFDAFIVRITLIPALMYLMGNAAWWLPRWLDRLLPHVDVEGAGLEHRRQAHRATGSDDAQGTEGGRELEPATA